jgi:hypothetical protein
MRKVIYKYKIEMSGSTIDRIVKLPKHADIISVGVQFNEIFIWAIVIPAHDLEDRVFRVYPTGMEIPLCEKMGEFLGSVLLFDGNLVFHVFECKTMKNEQRDD